MKNDSETNIYHAYEEAIHSAEAEIKFYVKAFFINQLIKTCDFKTIVKSLIDEYEYIYTVFTNSGAPLYMNYHLENSYKYIWLNFKRRCEKADNIDNEVKIVYANYLLQGQRIHVNKCYEYLKHVQSEYQNLHMNVTSGIFDPFFRLLRCWPPELKRTEYILGIEAERIFEEASDPQLSKKEIEENIFRINIDYFKLCLRYNSLIFRIQPITKNLLFIEHYLYLLNQNEILLSIDNEKPNEWHLFLKSFLENEYNYIKKVEIINEKKSQHDAVQMEEERKMAEIEKDNLETDKNEEKSSALIRNAFTYIKYSSHLSALTDMLNLLIKNEFVSDDTDLADFRKIFNNTTPEKPIKWKCGISGLYCFVKLLHREHKFIENLDKTIWKVAAKIFVDEDEKPFEWQKFKGQKDPAIFTEIETCVLKLK